MKTEITIKVKNIFYIQGETKNYFIHIKVMQSEYLKKGMFANINCKAIIIFVLNIKCIYM